MANIFIHIGLAKTATSTLQRQFFPACEGLNLLTAKNPEVKAFVKEVTLRDPLYFDAEKARELISFLTNSQKINLLSNESLSGPPYAGVIEAGLDHRSPILSNLTSVLPDAKVILVLRRQDALAKSFYRQYLTSGGTRKVHRFYGIESDKGPGLMSLDRFYFLKYVEAVVASFPAGVLILPFEEFVQNQDLFLKKITNFIGIPMPKVELKQENATRLGPFGMEVSRILNHLFRSLLNQGGILPGIHSNREGIDYRISPVQELHYKWPKSSRIKEGEISRLASKIFQMVQEDNKELDKRFHLNLRNYNYY